MQKHVTILWICGVCAASAAILGAVDIIGRRAGVHEPPATLAGRSATRLADRRWLMTGGDDGTGPVVTAVIVDPIAETTTTLGSALVERRAWHTATLLSNRQVLIVGGRGDDGMPLATAELFDPDTETFTTVAFANATPHAEHTATLLTDGRVLVAGGVDGNGAQTTIAEIWDAGAGTVAQVAGTSQQRSFHSAALTADGAVYISGGTDANGQRVATADLFVAATSTIGPWPDAVSDADGPPTIAEARPAAAAVGVPVDAFVTLRFSRVLDLASVTDRTIALSGPHGAVPVRVFAAEAGRLVFVRPYDLLEPSAEYTVSFGAVVDATGAALAASPLTFTTAGTEDADGEFWKPDDTSFDHRWVSGRPPSPWQTLAPLRAEPGVTAVSGQVLTLDGRPLAHVTIEIDEAEASTDDTGRFLVRLPDAVGAAHQELEIDGRSASRASRRYGIFEYGLTVVAGRTTTLPFTVWMPLLDTAHEVAIASPTVAETVITTPYIPGLELHLPAGTVIRDEDGDVVTTIGITPIPIDRTPFPLANGVDVPVYFTVQPGGAYIETVARGPKGGWLVYPNYHRDRPRQRVQFFHYDPGEKDWYVYGLGTVTADGTQVAPDPSTRLYELTGAMINTGASAANAAAKPGGDTVTDPVDPATGVFVMHKTDLELPDVMPLALTRVYNSGDAFSRPFGTGMTHPYAMFLWSAKQFEEADLILPEGGKIHFHRTSAGTGYRDAQFVHRETSELSATPTPFYGAVMSWNGDGWNVRLTDGTVYEFGINAPLQSITDRYGNKVIVSHERGRYGNVTRVTSPNGRWIAFAYDNNSHITQASDHTGRVVRYTYDANGNLATVVGADNSATTYTFTAANQLATIADARGITFLSNRYGADGRIAEQTLADPAARYQFAYTLNAAGDITQTEITDPRGVAERWTFNADQYVTEKVEAVGTTQERTTVLERQPRTNFVTATVDPVGRRTTYAYNTAGHLQTVTRLAGTPDSVTTTFAREPQFNLVQSMTDPLNHVWTTEYDAAGHLTGATDPEGVSTSFATDSAGRVTRITNPLHDAWQIGYSGADQISLTNPLGAVWDQFVDDGGRVVTSSDPLGRTTRAAYDSLDRVTSIVDAAGGEVRFGYDPNGRVTSLADPLNHAAAFEWDTNNRLAARLDPLQNAERYEYDLVGSLLSVTDRNGQTTGYEYDVLNRPTRVTYADGSTTEYSYDAGDRLIRIVDSIGGAIERQYDGLDRLTSETTPEGTVRYAFDADGRRTEMTVAGQTPVSYQYDSSHRLTAVLQGEAAVMITYDEVGRRRTLRLPNGTVATYHYDAASQVTGITYAAGTAVVGDLTYTYDRAGNPITAGGSLASSGVPPALTAAEYDVANRLTSWNAGRLAYDANGNVTSDGAITYTWNARNQLSAIAGASPSAFEYDGIGRRRGKVGATHSRFLYDGVNVVSELAGGNPVATMLTGGVDEVFQRVDSAGTHTVITDALGSTVALADESGGVATRYVYDPFGATTSTGEASANTTQFTGRESEPNGLYYSRARYYDPRRGRFLSEDPIGSFGGPNVYAYANNMPTRFTDPFGLYNRDVHYDLTRATAVQVGMCGGDAEAIAHADQGVDDDPWMNPMAPENVDARQWFHFTSDERREQLRREAFESGSHFAMGVYLHALQDSFSHQQGRKNRDGESFGPLIGHLPWGHAPDNPRRRPALWRRMAIQTANELWEFHRLYPTCQGR